MFDPAVRLTREEHEARAALLGRRYVGTIHTYNLIGQGRCDPAGVDWRDTAPASAIDASTLEPVKVAEYMERWSSGRHYPER